MKNYYLKICSILAFILLCTNVRAQITPGKPTPPGGITDTVVTNIVGGGNTTIAQRPFQVLLDVNGGLCGGVILSPNWIVTACHCTFTNGTGAALQPNQITVFAGVTQQSLRNNGQVRAVAQIIRHPGWGQTPGAAFDNDIAMLRLSTPLTLNTNVQQILLATEADINLGVGIATVSGWGRLADNGPVSDILQILDVPIVSNNTAATQWGAAFTNNMLATGFQGQAGRGNCDGDSGGPVTIPNLAQGTNAPLLAGLVSFGMPCATAQRVDVNTRISRYCAWIQQQLASITTITNSAICTTTTLSLQNVPPNTVATWSSSNTSILSVNSATGVATPGSADGVVVIAAQLSNGCVTVPITKSVSVRRNFRALTSPASPICAMTIDNTYTAPATPGATTYTWTSTNPNFYINNANTATTTIPSVQIGSNVPGQYVMNLVATTACGSTLASNPIYVQVDNCFGGFNFVAYPNPSNSELNIVSVKKSSVNNVQQTQSSTGNISDEEIFSLDAKAQLVNKYNQVLWEGKLKKGKANLSTSKIPNGIYYLKINSGNESTTKQIVVQH